MGMSCDLKVGEAVVATVPPSSEGCEIHIALGKKRGGSGARIVVTAPHSVKLTPPNKQDRSKI